MTMVNTRNILFICGGAFPDLENIIKERLNKSSSMGFMADLKDKYDQDKNLLRQTTVEDLKNFGMIRSLSAVCPSSSPWTRWMRICW